jgi:hypothetical protein
VVVKELGRDGDRAHEAGFTCFRKTSKATAGEMILDMGVLNRFGLCRIRGQEIARAHIESGVNDPIDCPGRRRKYFGLVEVPQYPALQGFAQRSQSGLAPQPGVRPAAAFQQ